MRVNCDHLLFPFVRFQIMLYILFVLQYEFDYIVCYFELLLLVELVYTLRELCDANTEVFH